MFFRVHAVGFVRTGMEIGPCAEHCRHLYCDRPAAVMGSVPGHHGAGDAPLSTTTIQYHFRLFDLLGNLASIQYPRFVGVVRIFMYLIAGYTFAVGLEYLRKAWGASCWPIWCVLLPRRWGFY